MSVKEKYQGTIILVALNVIIFLIFDVMTLGVTWGDLINLRLYKLVTATFGHYGFAHIASNMLALIAFGFTIEKNIGTPRFLALYLISGTIGNLLAIIIYSILGRVVILAGASGAIFGLLGYLNCIETKRKNELSKYNVYGSIKRSTLITLVISSMAGGSLVGHITGLIVGYVTGLWLIQRQI